MNIKQKILVFAVPVILFVVLHFVITILANGITNNPGERARDISKINYLAYLSYIVVGYVSGIFSNNRHLLNGVIVGGLSAFVAIYVFGVGVLGDNQVQLVLVVMGSVLGALGAVLSKLRLIGGKNDV